MKNLVLIITVVFSLATSDVLAKKKLFKWVDENGQVHYGDKIPPDQIKKKHKELNNQGIVVEDIENAITSEEVQAIREETIRKEKAAKIEKEKEKIRLNIIKAYTNEAEIVRLKDERIAALKRNIELAQQSIKFQQTSKEQLLSRAADNERNGLVVSEALTSRIEIIETKIIVQNKFMEVKKHEIKHVENKFDKDIAIYREAKLAKNKNKLRSAK